MKKRISAFALMLALLTGLFPAAAFAVDTPREVYVTGPLAKNGTGTKENPFNNMDDALNVLQNGGIVHQIETEVFIEGKPYSASGLASFSYTDEESVTRRLPNGDITVNANGNQLFFHGGIILNGNLTIKNAELIFEGATRGGYDRRIYCNGYDLTIENCTIGNWSGPTTTDNRGAVILAGGFRQDVPTRKATQTIRLNSGRISAIYAGGEQSKVTGDVSIEITAPQAPQEMRDLAFSEKKIFPLAGVYSNGLSSADVNNPQLDAGSSLEGALSVSLNGKISGFETYRGNGNAGSTFQIINSGIGYREPNFSGFQKLDFVNADIVANLTDVSGVKLQNNAALRPKTSDAVTLKTLTGAGDLLLKPRQAVTVTDEFSGSFALKVNGTPAGIAETVTYLTAPEVSTGSLTLGGQEIVPVVENAQKHWKITGETPLIAKTTLEVKRSSAAVSEIELPEGRFAYGSPYIDIDIKSFKDNGAFVDAPYQVTFAGDAYAQRFMAQPSALSYYFTLKESGTEELIPAGDMTITGSVEVVGTIYSASKTLRMVVVPSIDFHIERRLEGDFLVSTLKGAADFEGTIAVGGHSIPISAGDSVELAAETISGAVKAVFTPQDTVYYRSAEKTHLVDRSPKITVTQITESGKTLADAALAADKGTVAWVKQDGSTLENSTPIVWGTTYRWKCTPSVGAASIYGNVVFNEGEAPEPPVEKVTPTGTPTAPKITESGKTLADAPLSGTFKDDQDEVVGTLAWDLPATTAVIQGTSYGWTFTPTQTEKYNPVTGSIVLWEKSNGSGGGGGGGGGGGAPEPPVTPPVTDEKPAPSITVTEEQTGTPADIPSAEKPTSGMVAVLVRPDGSREVVKNSVLTDTGVRFTPQAAGVYELVDNAKRFTDVPQDAWYRQAADYASARELVSGVGNGSLFAPEDSMTRGMLVTVLYRYEGANVQTADSAWYAPGRAWSMQTGLSDGSDMEQNVTREQLATMLWRYARTKGWDVSAGADMSRFLDAAQISAYALPSIEWAVNADIMSGKGEGRLDPAGNATRAEMAAMLMRFFQGAAAA